jgi:hypothetical protein
VTLAVDLFPREQRVRMKGSYALENKSAQPVRRLLLAFAPAARLVVHQLDIGVPSRLEKDDVDLGVRLYRLEPPLPPGAKTTLAFDVELPTRGFRNEGSNTSVVYNGSFINGREVLPLIGYQDRGELERDQDRKKFGLAPKERMRDRDDPAGLAVNALQGAADFIDFEATVSTEPDQIAISPGYLRAMTENGRRLLHYKMDAPILNPPPSSRRLRGEEGRLAGPAATSRSRSTTSRGTSSTSTR